MTPSIRPESPADHKAIHQVNRLAFGQDDEAVLVDALRAGGHARLSLVAEIDGDVVGHVLFSDLPILTDRGVVPALALAPVAVRPNQQRREFGSALIRAVGGRSGGRASHRRRPGPCRVLPPLRVLREVGRTPLVAVLRSGFVDGSGVVPGALDGVEGGVQYAPPFGIEQPARIRSASNCWRGSTRSANSHHPRQSRSGRAASLVSITRTDDELSVVCRAEDVPEGVACDATVPPARRGHDAVQSRGSGGVADDASGECRGGCLRLSTFDTDYLLIKTTDLARAISALRGVGGDRSGSCTRSR